MQTPKRPVVHGNARRQLTIALDRPALNGMTTDDRNTAVRRLARLLMEASGMDIEDIGDDER